MPVLGGGADQLGLGHVEHGVAQGEQHHPHGDAAQIGRFQNRGETFKGVAADGAWILRRLVEARRRRAQARGAEDRDLDQHRREEQKIHRPQRRDQQARHGGARQRAQGTARRDEAV